MTTPAIPLLDRCMEADFDFTHSNEVVLTFLNIITCPIKFEATDYMFIFNDHYYDFQDFGQYRTLEYGCIKKREDSGYRTKIKLKIRVLAKNSNSTMQWISYASVSWQ